MEGKNMTRQIIKDAWNIEELQHQLFTIDLEDGLFESVKHLEETATEEFLIEEAEHRLGIVESNMSLSLDDDDWDYYEKEQGLLYDFLTKYRK